MKILHYINYFSPNTHIFIYDYIIELENSGIENFVLTFNRVNEQNRPFDRVIVVKFKRNLVWLVLRILAEFNRKPNKKWTIMRREISKILQKIKPEIIHAQFGPEGTIIGEVAYKLKIPLIVTFHGYDISILVKQKFWLNSYKKLFNIGQLFMGVSNHICNKLILNGCPENKVVKFSAGIRIENFKFRLNTIDPQSEIKLIHVGRLIEKKSPLSTVKAFKIVTDYFGDKLNITLTIIGKGPLKEQVIELINNLSLVDKVKIIGEVEHSEIMNYLFVSHIYVQHCLTASDGDEEGLGMSFLEASAIGLPIVTTRHNGIPDAVLDSKTGYLVEEGDIEDMANKIIHLIKNPQIAQEFGIAGRQHVENNYDIHKQVKKAIAYYSKLLQKNYD